MSEHFDLVVIGAGPAGEKGAVQAAYFGKRVCLIERAPKPGGAAVNGGTIPSKTLRETALVFSGLRQRGLYAVEFNVRPDVTVADFMHRERTVVEASWQLISDNLDKHGVTSMQGVATFLDPRTIQVERHRQPTRTITGDVFLIAAGSQPWRPAHINFDGRVILDTIDLLSLENIPPRLLVIGGGPIACEYACTFAALGSQVTLVTESHRVLDSLDIDVSEALRREFTRRLGVHVVTGLAVTAAFERDGLGVATLADGTETIADAILFSGGRQGATSDLGLDHAGVAVDAHGFVQVDDKFRTSITHIVAAGDVIGTHALASTAMEQARVAVCHAFGLRYKQAVSGVIPMGVWTIPEAATVGLSEHEAESRLITCETGRAPFRTNARGQILGDTEGFVKLVFGRDDLRLLGASVVGEGATELIHLASAVIAHGGTIDYFIQATFNYPSLSECFKYAAYDGLQRVQRRIKEQGGMRRVED